MRRLSGATDLRAVVYMDEVFGYAPPTANPPSKKPILTMLKQARAFGVGLVLSTQNPVDLDYKAMSNTGTWMIGRLQTERDKARILEALESARGGSDMKAIDQMISGLGKRQFLLHNTREPEPSIFSTRWAMSYLRGPLTREEVSRLTAEDPARQASPASRRPHLRPAEARARRRRDAGRARGGCPHSGLLPGPGRSLGQARRGEPDRHPARADDRRPRRPRLRRGQGRPEARPDLGSGLLSARRAIRSVRRGGGRLRRAGLPLGTTRGRHLRPGRRSDRRLDLLDVGQDRS